MEKVKVQSAGGIIYRLNGRQIYYLVVRHVKTTDHWGFPKGRLELGEDCIATAMREISEETGISNFVFEPGFSEKTEYSFEKEGKEYEKTVTFFIAKTEKEEIILSAEHSEFFWGTYDEVKEKLSNESDINLFKKVNDFIKMKYSDVLLISFPKAGRTWLSALISATLQKEFNLDFKDIMNIEKITFSSKFLPSISLIHEDSPENKEPHQLNRKKDFLQEKKVILLTRDPRDIIVSWYFHQHKRKKRFKGDISSFINNTKGGFDTIIEYYNIWASYKGNPNLHIVHYEDIYLHTEESLMAIMKFLNIPVSTESIKYAVETCTFEKMQEMERKNIFNLSRLKPGDVNDPDSYKVRKGKIGGYKDYLSLNEIALLNNKMEKLNI
jgi:8-oxo-dGTP pyrophosphatase MutT (NUDIX family)